MYIYLCPSSDCSSCAFARDIRIFRFPTNLVIPVEVERERTGFKMCVCMYTH